jgi:hypothetical protein
LAFEAVFTSPLDVLAWLEDDADWAGVAAVLEVLEVLALLPQAASRSAAAIAGTQNLIDERIVTLLGAERGGFSVRYSEGRRAGGKTSGSRT